jgi:hypothetical protein
VGNPIVFGWWEKKAGKVKCCFADAYAVQYAGLVGSCVVIHVNLDTGAARGFPDLKQPTSASARTERTRTNPVNIKRRGHAANYQIDGYRPPTLVMPQLTLGDSRTPAASSTANGSVFYDTRDTSSDGATVRGRDTDWQTPYVTDYRVRAAGPAAIFAEPPPRFRYNKERTIERGKSAMTPRTFVTTQRTSVMTPRTSAAIPRTSVMMPGASVVIQRTS